MYFLHTNGTISPFPKNASLHLLQATIMYNILGEVTSKNICKYFAFGRCMHMRFGSCYIYTINDFLKIDYPTVYTDLLYVKY